MGRPTDYRDAYCEQAHKLALLGAKDLEMADFFNASPRAFYKWRKAHPEFAEAIQSGKDMADANVAASLYRRATGYSQETVKLFMPAGRDAPVSAPFTEHVPPDTQAATWWLKNRRREDWKDRQEVEHSGSVTVAASALDEKL